LSALKTNLILEEVQAVPWVIGWGGDRMGHPPLYSLFVCMYQQSPFAKGLVASGNKLLPDFCQGELMEKVRDFFFEMNCVYQEQSNSVSANLLSSSRNSL
jgi:hypothetical protein